MALTNPRPGRLDYCFLDLSCASAHAQGVGQTCGGMLEAVIARMKATLRKLPASQACTQGQGRRFRSAQSQVTRLSLRVPWNLLSTCGTATGTSHTLC